MERLHLKIYCGYTCNQHCSYCDVIHNQDEDFVKTKEVEYLISKSKLPVELSIDGGEAFCYPEIVKWSQSLNIPVTYLTNATLLTPEIVAGLNQYTTLKISLDGPKFIHDQQRSNYDKVIENINLVKQYKIPFDIGTTCTELSLIFLNKIKAEIDSIGPRIWTLTPQMFREEGGRKKTKAIYLKAKELTKNWDFPNYRFCLPNFFDDTEVNEDIEILIKNKRIEVHPIGFTTEQIRLYTFDELEDLINDWI